MLEAEVARPDSSDPTWRFSKNYLLVLNTFAVVLPAVMIRLLWLSRLALGLLDCRLSSYRQPVFA